MPSSVSGTGSSSNNLSAASTASALAKNKVTQDQFLKLLVTQLANQDPLNPLSNEDFITQLAQFQSLQETMDTAKNTKNLLLGQQLATASSMIGKQVVVAGADGQDYIGTVSKVAVDNGEVLLVVGDTGVTIDQIKEVRPASTTGA